jgi:N-acetylated-alpha-linked acidic dipeptidase
VTAFSALLLLLAVQDPLVGFSPATAAAHRRHEAAAIARPSPAVADRHSKALSERPHVAGTDGQARTRDYVIDAMRAMGLQTDVREYPVYLPHPVELGVWRLGDPPLRLDLDEGAIPEDPTSGAFPQTPPIAGYSGTGDVSGELVYVNYGLIEDYAVLDSLGVSVRGKVAIARYGRSFRGIKAREAERRGAIGLLVYSDPLDDGFAQGDPYPVGPMRPSQGVQRGSYMNGVGDPTTPGWASTPGARRLPFDSIAVPRIPVIPIAWKNAQLLMEGMRGADLPSGWQGAMPFRYHVGPGPVRARVLVRSDSATVKYKPVWNTFGVIRGRERPDELVLIGAHRDGWGPGAGDNVSGVVSVLEAARAVMEQVRAGWTPRRTMVFATWDAEEWGLVGSTEFVEQERDRLTRGLVAYLNQDGGASGKRFGGGGSPSLRPLLRAVARAVPDPSGGTVYAQWRAATGIRSDTLEPPMGDPGGGSDFAGFYNHLGIPHSDWGFGGAGGVYHSAYDSYWWMSRFGDKDFQYHATAGRIGAAMMMRLANAEVLPHDYVEFARTMRNYLAPIERNAQRRGWTIDTRPLAEALGRMETAARTFAMARDAALTAGLAPARADAANAALLRVEKELTRPEGLHSRPWYRNLIYVADVDNGYANMVFPSVNEALRYGTAAEAQAELADLVARFDRATGRVAEATAALR